MFIGHYRKISSQAPKAQTIQTANPEIAAASAGMRFLLIMRAQEHA
jgi:hypothetical protein